jgi:integrase
MYKTRHQNTAGAGANLRPEMTFREAAAEWMRSMTFSPTSDGPSKAMGFIRWRTLRDYRTTCLVLEKHFGDMHLQAITPPDVRKFQELRAGGAFTAKIQRHMAGPGACATTINKELGLLMRMLRRSKAWTPDMLECYMPLRYEQPDKQRALTPEQQQRFLNIAASKDKWLRVYWYSVLCLHTTVSTNEIRGLRIRDLDISQAVMIVRPESAKNKYRIRTIPLDPEALKAAAALIELARERGSVKPEHFVFAFRDKRNNFNPQRPMGESGIRPQWQQLRAAADVPWLRQYDLRHTAITRLAEAGTPIQVIMDMAGHISFQMQQHYTHISQQAKRTAVAHSSAATAERNTGKRGPSRAVAAPSQMAGGFSMTAMIAQLRSRGMSAEDILSVLTAGQEGAA